MHHYNALLALLFRASKLTNGCPGIAIVCSLGYLFLESSLVWCGYAWIFVSQGRVLLNRYKKNAENMPRRQNCFPAAAVAREQSLHVMLHVSYFLGIVWFRIQSLSCQAKYQAITNSAGPLPPVVRSWCLEMEHDGQYEYLQTPLSFLHARAARDLGRRHKLSPTAKSKYGKDMEIDMHGLTHVIVIVVSRSSVNWSGTLWCQPCLGLNICAKLCHGNSDWDSWLNAWHRQGCFAWNRW